VAQVEGGWSLKVEGNDTEDLIAKHVIVATGSSARALPDLPFDEDRVLSNDGALALTEVPKRLGVIGGGAIGLEMAAVWGRLGAEVTILEALPEFLATIDRQAAKEMRKALEQQGMNIHTGVKTGDISVNDKVVNVAYTDADGKDQALEVDRLIVSIGRVPNVDGLGAETVGLKI